MWLRGLRLHGTGCHRSRRLTHSLTGAGRRTDLDANYLARNNQLDSPIQLTAGRGIVRSYGIVLAVADCGHVLRVHALREQEIANGIRALFRETLIELVTARAVGIAFDLKIQAWMGHDDTGDARQSELGRFFQRVFRRIEEDILHVYNEATWSFARRQYSVELLQQLFTKLILFGFR